VSDGGLADEVIGESVHEMSSRASWIQKRFRDGVSNRLRTFAGGRWAAQCRPTWISFLLTERCNARCLHCDIWKNRGQEDSPSTEQWKGALSDLRRWLGPAHVCLTGGEALLKPFAADLVAHGSSIGLFVELLTHGYWKDQTRIEQLAAADPWRVTLSLDGLGETHDRVRGRTGFFERTQKTIETLTRARAERNRDFSIRLKTVVMSHNLDALSDLAEFATRVGADVLYQAIERNYNSPEDPHWYQQSPNWPQDPGAALSAIDRLIRLKREGRAIANSEHELEVMKRYFSDPDAWQTSVKAHSAHESRANCAALGLVQVQSNGDVRVCSSMDPVGNIKSTPLPEIWASRPHWWESGCCLSDRMSEAERENRL
jgi:MoaA/NifB/PqqE/SkfB family radical SAM enzyme